jgi:hypothetical protein
MKKKFQLVLALLFALIISGGTYAYAFTTAGDTISVAEPTGDIATCIATETQPDWNSVLDDLASDNKTCGEAPSGTLFDVTPSSTYSGDLVANVYLANSANLTKAYRYLNMKLYLSGSEEAGETPNYRMLTLQNGETGFNMAELQPVAGTWTQTSEAEFGGGTLNQVEVISPGDVILDTFSDNVTDTFDNETKIAASANVTVSGGQVYLTTTGSGSGTETLRPDSAGDETLITDQFPVTGEHWDKVDDVTSDDDSTYVSTEKSWEEDLYNIPNHSTGAGDINYVRVYMVARGTIAPTQTNAYFHIKTNGAEHNSPEITTTAAYAPYSYQWDNNPETTNPWTWDEIDALQIGVGIRNPKAKKETRVTQVYVEVNYTDYSYYTKGTITSINLLSGETVKSIDSFDYNASAIPSGTGLKVQFSQDGTNWYNSAGTPGGWNALSQGTHNIDLSGLSWSGANFYYHMEFTSDGSDTPVLDEIRVNFSTYYSSGDLTSSAYDTGYDLAWDWGTISFTIDEPSGTDIVFQIRTAATEAGLSSATWYGPTGTSDNYTTSGTDINSVHDGDRWIQYKAYFADTGTSTPTLSDVSITYSGQAVAFTIEVIGGSYCLVSDNTSEWGAGWTVAPELYCEITQR